MCQDSSARYYQKKKEKTKKKILRKILRSFQRRKRKQYERGRNKNLSENKKIKAC